MTKESTKNKTKKSNPSSNTDLDTFIKMQHNTVSRLKAELKSMAEKMNLLENGTEEKEHRLEELEQIINQREGEIHKLTVNMEQLKEDDKQILTEYNLFKEKFYQLEIEYDKSLSIQYHEIETLRSQLGQQQTNENQEIQQLSLKCQDLQQSLQDNMNDINQLNKRHGEALQNLEQMKLKYEEQQKEFELFKKEVMEDKILDEEKRKLEFATLTGEIKQKDETLKQCISDKNALEKEKNLVIDELNNKIYRIERAFTQPTKAVQPMVTLPQQINNSDTSEGSNENVAIGLPQVRKPLENLALEKWSNIENQKTEQNLSQRNYKFKRPLQPTTSSQQSNTQTNVSSQRKRRNQPRQSSIGKKIYNEFSLSSSEEDNDKESTYTNFSNQLWRPDKDECYVTGTDTSEGFGKAKRSRNKSN